MQRNTTKPTTVAVLRKCPPNVPFNPGNTSPQSQGTRLVRGKITSRVSRNCFHRAGERIVGLGGREPEFGTGADFDMVVFQKQRSHFLDVLLALRRVDPAIEIVQIIETYQHGVGLFAMGRSDDIDTEVTFECRGIRHDPLEPFFIFFLLVGIQAMRNDQGHMPGM